jgi:hypothetical protein
METSLAAALQAAGMSSPPPHASASSLTSTSSDLGGTATLFGSSSQTYIWSCGVVANMPASPLPRLVEVIDVGAVRSLVLGRDVAVITTMTGEFYTWGAVLNDGDDDDDDDDEEENENGGGDAAGVQASIKASQQENSSDAEIGGGGGGKSARGTGTSSSKSKSKSNAKNRKGARQRKTTWRQDAVVLPSRPRVGSGGQFQRAASRRRLAFACAAQGGMLAVDENGAVCRWAPASSSSSTSSSSSSSSVSSSSLPSSSQSPFVAPQYALDKALQARISATSASATNISRVAGGAGFALAVTGDGGVVGWGDLHAACIDDDDNDNDDDDVKQKDKVNDNDDNDDGDDGDESSSISSGVGNKSGRSQLACDLSKGHSNHNNNALSNSSNNALNNSNNVTGGSAVRCDTRFTLLRAFAGGSGGGVPVTRIACGWAHTVGRFNHARFCQSIALASVNQSRSLLSINRARFCQSLHVLALLQALTFYSLSFSP